MSFSKRHVVAIVGRPNVGKSTLFNRLARRRCAIVENTPGVTRDRHFADVELDDCPVTLVDTGGFMPSEKVDSLVQLVHQQAAAAVESCEVIIFVCDGKVGLTPADEEIAKYLRKQVQSLVLAVNKCDNYRTSSVSAADFYRLGLVEPIPVSAEHGENISILIEHIKACLPAYEAPGAEEKQHILSQRPLRICIVGRPNVGKSTLVNALLGEERVIVSPVAGTTRDPIDSEVTWKRQRIVLTDTAGIRKKTAITHKVEQFSVLGAVRAIEDSDVAVLVLDATEPAVEQDLRIASLAEQRGRALILCVNKWDLVGSGRKAFSVGLQSRLKWISWAPIVFVTAKTGAYVTRIFDVSMKLAGQFNFRVPTPKLNKLIQYITDAHPMPICNGRPLRLYYAAQVGKAPQAFAIICSNSQAVPDRYARYVQNYLRAALGLQVPMRLFWRDRPGEAERKMRAHSYKARALRKKRRIKAAH